MVRVLSLAAILVAVSAVSATAQIITNPVVTSWPSEVRLMPYPMPAQPPVALDACTPPVVTYCNPCATGAIPAVPTMTYMAPTTTYYLPTTTYYAPTTAFRLPVLAPFWRPATTTYYAPSVAYYRPVTNYRMPSPPEINVFAGAGRGRANYLLLCTDGPSDPHAVNTGDVQSGDVQSGDVQSSDVQSSGRGRSCGCGGR